MKIQNVILSFILFFLLFAESATGQNQKCKVLLKTINDTYQGECRNGYAHGEGIALGKDVYKGEFKKGLPHGYGKYVWKGGKKIYEGEWKNGKRSGKGKMIIKKSERDSVITGIWEDNKFVKRKDQDPYEVLRKRGIERVRIYRFEGDAKIEIDLRRHAGNKRVSDLMVDINSGNLHKNLDPMIVSSPDFPFKAEIYYLAPNKLGSRTKTCEVDFIINEPGRWVVEIYY
jgi:hypothetical protein